MGESVPEEQAESVGDRLAVALMLGASVGVTDSVPLGVPLRHCETVELAVEAREVEGLPVVEREREGEGVWEGDTEAEGLRDAETVTLPERLLVMVLERVRVMLEVRVVAPLPERVSVALPETEGSGVAERGPKTQLMVTATAAAYTESPVCVTVSVHVPPALVEFKYPVL